MKSGFNTQDFVLSQKMKLSGRQSTAEKVIPQSHQGPRSIHPPTPLSLEPTWLLGPQPSHLRFRLKDGKQKKDGKHGCVPVNIFKDTCRKKLFLKYKQV